MTLKNYSLRLLLAVLALIVLAGCRASGNQRAPIEDRANSNRNVSSEDREYSSRRVAAGRKPWQRDQDSLPKLYVIQKGDTLYSIAFENGLDYREVAEQNNIENPAAIQIGQQIRLLPSSEGGVERVRVDSKPVPPATPRNVYLKDQPKVGKLPYSEKAFAQIEKMQYGSVQAALPPAVIAPPSVTPPEAKPTMDEDSLPDDGFDWGIPTRGRVISEYSEIANRKGVDIAGSKGQAVLASASGKVVYSGSGLRGYGKLVIIKHNKTYLSAYAHNDQLLVKEGQSVSKGQKIADMGSSDTDQVKLHFEIRKFGKPVDPAKYLDMAKF